jgi:hypothetical protein
MSWGDIAGGILGGLIGAFAGGVGIVGGLALVAKMLRRKGSRAA